MTARRWDGTAWVPFNELLSRFGDATIRPTIKHYQDGVFGLGWYPLRSIKRWTGTAWVNVYQARLLPLPPPPPPPKPDPITGITPPPPPPPPEPEVQGPVIFNDEGIPMELDEDGEIVPFSIPPGNFDTGEGNLIDSLAGTENQQRALIRRTVGNLRAGRAASVIRVVSINLQRSRYGPVEDAIRHSRTTRTNLRTAATTYKFSFNPSSIAVKVLTSLIDRADSIREQYAHVTGLSQNSVELIQELGLAITQRNAERFANNQRTIARNSLRTTYNASRRVGSFIRGDNDEPFLPASSAG